MSDKRVGMLRGLTLARLKELLHYDPDTGKFTRLVSVRGHKVGSDAGCLKADSGYISIRIDGEIYYAHILAWFYMTGEWPISLCDHKYQDRSDNRWKNLREANGSQNLMNSKMWSNNKSGVKGVWLFRSRGKWVAEIKVRGRKICLGYYTAIEDAAAARRAAEIKHFGEFAALPTIEP